MALVRREVSTRGVGWVPLALGMVAFPAGAQAHSAATGLGEFWSGALHPLATPTHGMILLGLGLLCGRRMSLRLKMPVMVFVSVSAVALALTVTGWIKAVPPPALIALALALGVLLALDKDPPQSVLAAIYGGAALGLGLDSAVETGPPMTVTKTLLGTWASLVVLAINVPIYVSLGHELRWLRIAIQIAGSWMVAVSLMMLAFYFRRT